MTFSHASPASHPLGSTRRSRGGDRSGQPRQCRGRSPGPRAMPCSGAIHRARPVRRYPSRALDPRVAARFTASAQRFVALVNVGARFIAPAHPTMHHDHAPTLGKSNDGISGAVPGGGPTAAAMMQPHGGCGRNELRPYTRCGRQQWHIATQCRTPRVGAAIDHAHAPVVAFITMPQQFITPARV